MNAPFAAQLQQALGDAAPLPRPGTRVIVTGAAGGIGRALVRALGLAECRVAALDLEPALAGPAIDGAAVALPFNQRDAASAKQGVEGAVHALGGLDAVICNAAVVDIVHSAARFPDDEFRRDIETNLFGPYQVARAAYPHLTATSDPRLVFVSSIAAEAGMPGMVAYAAAKAGVLGLMRTLAGEWADAGIKVNAVTPGIIATPKVERFTPAMREAIEAHIPLGRFGRVEEVAGVLAFLLSPAAGYIDGAVIPINGGMQVIDEVLFRRR